MNIQKGFAHIFLVIGLLVIIIGLLSVVFWKKYADIPSTPTEVTYKEYVSITDSGLSFTYPDTWTLHATEKVAEASNGDKFASAILFSQVPNKNSDKPEVPSDHICVTLSEFAGEWPGSYGPPNSEVTNSDFTIGENKVGLITHEDSSKGYFSASLVSVDPFERGASYIALNNDYFLKATSQKNCYPSDNPKQRDVSVDIEQAKAILKSVKLVD